MFLALLSSTLFPVGTIFLHSFAPSDQPALLSEGHLLDMIVNDIEKHVSSLTESFTEYFPNLQSKNNYWVQNPFKVTEKPIELTATEYENLIEITCDSVLKAKFEEFPAAVFRGKLNSTTVYKKLSKQSKRGLLAFSSTYLCELGFSRYSQNEDQVSR